MSAKVKETTFNSRDTLRVTTSDAIPMKKIQDGFEFNYKGYVIQEVVKEDDGEVFEAILVKSEEGPVYATRSATFTNQLKEIIEAVTLLEQDEETEETEPLRLRVVKGISKNDKEYITCALA